MVLGEEESSVAVDVDVFTAGEVSAKREEEVEDKREEIYVEDGEDEDMEEERVLDSDSEIGRRLEAVRNGVAVVDRAEVTGEIECTDVVEGSLERPELEVGKSG
jgi:hypothetical protein